MSENLAPTTPPKEYMQWVDLFSYLSNSPIDDSILEIIKNGSLEWQKGVAERFIDRVSAMWNARLESANKRFDLALKGSHDIESKFILALKSLRREYDYLEQITKALPIDEETKKASLENLANTRKQAQEHQEKDLIKIDRTGKLLRIVKNNPLN